MVIPEILGQTKALRLLDRALDGGRLAHAYLLRGPDGVGKATTAQKVAATLLCQADKTLRPCGVCGGCRKFSSANHPDFLHVRPDGAVIKIDQVRRLKKELNFPPMESGQRVILLEDVHTMRREAGNSLLKLLEEPPPDNVLLLTADEAEPLLPTILSRCQIIPFNPLPPATANMVLRDQYPALDDDKLRQLAGLSGGCPGRLKSFDVDELLATHHMIFEALLREYGSEAERIEKALAAAMHITAAKEGMEMLLEILRHFFKDVMQSKLRLPAASSHEQPSSCLEQARERWNLDELSDKIKTVDFARQALARNCNRQMVGEVLFLRLLTESDNEISKVS